MQCLFVLKCSHPDCLIKRCRIKWSWLYVYVSESMKIVSFNTGSNHPKFKNLKLVQQISEVLVFYTIFTVTMNISSQHHLLLLSSSLTFSTYLFQSHQINCFVLMCFLEQEKFYMHWRLMLIWMYQMQILRWKPVLERKRQWLLVYIA